MNAIPRRIPPLAAALAALALPASAAAAPDWTPPSTLAGHVTPSFGYAGGEQTEAYTELVSRDPLRTRVVVTTSRPGEAPRTQLEIPTTSDGFPSDTYVAVAPTGQAVLAYRQTIIPGVPTPSTFHVRYRTADGVWEPDQVVASDEKTSDTSGASMRPAIGRDGTAAVIIDHHEKDDPGEAFHDQRTDVAIHPAGGDWESTFRLSTPNRSTRGSDIGVDAAGNITATYAERFDEPGNRDTAIIRRRSASNKVWTTPEDLTQSAPAGKAGAPKLAVGPDGRAVIALQRNGIAVAAVRESAAGQFGPLARVSPEGSGGGAIASGLAPDGTAYVAYSVTSGEPAHVGLVRAAPGDSFTPPRRISPTPVDRADAQIAFAGNDAVVGWTAKDIGADTGALQGTRWAAGAAQPDAFHDLDSAAGDALLQVIGDGEGAAGVVWATGLDAHVAAFDGGGPSERGTEVPQAATVGQAATLRASFADRWSPLAGEPSWDFGDGATATGGEVSHAWAAPGDYTVRLRGADTFGNATERTFAVHVTGVGAAPQPAAPVIPTVTLKAPKCSKKLSKAACKRFVLKPAAWKKVTGTAANATRVTVTVKRKGAKTRTFKSAIKNGKWSAKLSGLKAGGTTTISAQAIAADGAKSKPAARRLRLRR
jgi:hypothetical protein